MIGYARRPAASTARQVSSGLRLLPCTTTSAPASARPTAMAAPMPREAPVTSAVRPVRSNDRRHREPSGFRKSSRTGVKMSSKTTSSSSMVAPCQTPEGKCNTVPGPDLALLVADR